jgi:hypothetical protein
MIRNGVGGANTQTGIRFEERVDLVTRLSEIEGYRISLNENSKGKSNWYDIFYQDSFVASAFKQHALYTYLDINNVNYQEILSKKLLPDEAIYVIKENTIFIIEIKFQNGAGSVDEKLQTCDFKKKQYQKIFSQLNYEVEYIYILNDWFKKPEYKDVLDYILMINCKYYFEYLPLHKIGLPIPH